MWTDGVYSGLRGAQMKLCALVVIDLMNAGKIFSDDSRRHQGIDTKLAISDGAMGFWAGP